MKIAMMTNNYKPFIGGVPISIERLSDSLRKAGHEVIVFAPTYENQMYDENIVRYRTFKKGLADGVVVPNPIDKKIEDAFKKENFDVIHVHHPMLIGNTAVHLSKKYGIPLTFTYHTRYEQYLHYLKPIKWLENGVEKPNIVGQLQRESLELIKENLLPSYFKKFFNNCNHIFAPTDGIEDYLMNTCDINQDKISVLPTGLREESFLVDKAACQQIRNKYQANDCPLFISVSRLSHEKNIPFLLHSLAYYKMIYQKPFKMLLIGDGPDRQEYEDLCKKLRIENEIIFTGKIANEEIGNYYHASDLFLFASKSETQGIVLLEAMAASTPIVSLMASGVSDLVKHGTNGYCLKEDHEQFAKHMNQLLSDSYLYQQFSQNALKTAYSFSADEVASQALAAYEKVIHQSYKNLSFPVLQFSRL